MEYQPPEPSPSPEGRAEQARTSRPPEIDGGNATQAAYMQITPTLVVPASQSHMLLMSVTGIAGIMGAVLTAYIAAHAPAREFEWLLGFAVAELALAAVAETALVLAVVLRLRLARNGHGAVVGRRKVRLVSLVQPLSLIRESQRSGGPVDQQQKGSFGDSGEAEAGPVGP